MMKKLIPVLLLTSLSITNTYAASDNRFTASIEIGSASTQINNNNVINTYTQLTPSSTFSTDTSSLLFSFTYMLDAYLSIGTDYLLSGSLTATESNINYKLFSTDSLSVYAKIGTAINPRVAVFGKLGVHLWTLTEDLNAPGGLDDGVDLTYGAGTSIDVYGGSERQLQIQWIHYEYNDVYVSSQDNLSLGILFLF